MSTPENDLIALRKLNAQFIRNFVTQDAVSHDEILHQDFVCIQNSGQIMGRAEYLEDWSHSYADSGFTGFEYTDEFIRIFGSVALVRSKTTWKKGVGGMDVQGSSVYTDTYVKEGGRWWCVQAQITPIL